MPAQQAEVYGVAPDGDPWELDRTTLALGTRLGAGQYGEVFRAQWKTQQRPVAVKTLIEGRMAADDFLREADVMKKVRFIVVKLCGP